MGLQLWVVSLAKRPSCMLVALAPFGHSCSAQQYLQNIYNALQNLICCHNSLHGRVFFTDHYFSPFLGLHACPSHNVVRDIPANPSHKSLPFWPCYQLLKVAGTAICWSAAGRVWLLMPAAGTNLVVCAWPKYTMLPPISVVFRNTDSCDASPFPT